MTYGRHLEQRKFGVYYFRQTKKIEGKQTVKRFSLKTKDLGVAKFLALQFLANIAMNEIDMDGIKKFEVEYDERGGIKRLKIEGEEDRRNFQDAMTLVEFQKAQQHQRELEKLKFETERELKEKLSFTASERGQELLSLGEKLDRELSEKTVPTNKTLETLRDEYLANVTVTSGTAYKYKNFLAKLLSYATNQNVKSARELDRKFVWNFLLFLRAEGKKNETIKNIFNTLSTFYNHLLTSGEAEKPNPFVGHNLKAGVAIKGKANGDEDDEATGHRRLPFTDTELEAIFSSPEVLADKQLCYIAMLLLTTGARPNEICQLWKDDIQADDGIDTIRIVANAHKGQTLKTPHSRRLIYLNQLLKDAGFLNYVASRKDGMLFDLNKPAMKTYSTFISEKFTKILRGLKVKNKTLYCFRNTAINVLKQSNLPKISFSEDLVGHTPKTVHEKVYPQRHSARLLKEATEQYLMYPQVKSLRTM